MMRDQTTSGNDPSTESVHALQVESLGFRYGAHVALDDVSVQVAEGEFVALLGANGAGKTTFFSIVTGLYSALSGSVSIVGNDIRADTLSALAGMGVVFQRTTLDTDLSISQNLNYAAALQGISRSDAAVRIGEAVQQHSLAGLESRKVASLSGGQRRRVELARALLHKPRLLLLDEPTVGLDSQSRADFVAHVKALCRDQNTGVLWATHLMDEVTSADSVFILDKGKLVAQGKVSELLVTHGVSDVAQLFNTLVKRASA